MDLGHAIEREERAAEIERELNAPVRPALTSRPHARAGDPTRRRVRRVPGRFLEAHARHRPTAAPTCGTRCRWATLSEGGYTVPDEFERQLIQGLEDENIMRGLVHKITTSSGDRKIPLVTSKGAAAWVEEEAAIPESDDAFGQVTLGAHKVASMIRISEELLHDSAFDLAGLYYQRVRTACGCCRGRGHPDWQRHA